MHVRLAHYNLLGKKIKQILSYRTTIRACLEERKVEGGRGVRGLVEGFRTHSCLVGQKRGGILSSPNMKR